MQDSADHALEVVTTFATTPRIVVLWASSCRYYPVVWMGYLWLSPPQIPGVMLSITSGQTGHPEDLPAWLLPGQNEHDVCWARTRLWSTSGPDHPCEAETQLCSLHLL